MPQPEKGKASSQGRDIQEPEEARQSRDGVEMEGCICVSVYLWVYVCVLCGRDEGVQVERNPIRQKTKRTGSRIKKKKKKERKKERRRKKKRKRERKGVGLSKIDGNTSNAVQQWTNEELRKRRRWSR